MFETDCRINLFLVKYCQTMTGDVPDERFAEQPMPGVNHPAWILGHVALTTDSASKLLGGSKVLPESWNTLFGRGSVATTTRTDYPSKEELVAAVDSGFQRVRDLAAVATSEMVGRPNPNPMLRGAMPTVQDLCAFLMTGHFSIHLGQLSMWRRMIGLSPLF